MSQLQPVKRNGAITPQQMAEYVTDPLRQIPKQFRAPTWDFWAFYSDTLKTQLSLCTRVRHWIDDGLELDDLIDIYRGLMQPGASKKYQFAGQILADLASEVDTILIRRRKTADMSRLREQEASDRANAAPPEVVRELLSSMFS